MPGASPDGASLVHSIRDGAQSSMSLPRAITLRACVGRLRRPRMDRLRRFRFALPHEVKKKGATTAPSSLLVVMGTIELTTCGPSGNPSQRCLWTTRNPRMNSGYRIRLVARIVPESPNPLAHKGKKINAHADEENACFFFNISHLMSLGTACFRRW